jgi:hypothetical protein
MNDDLWKGKRCLWRFRPRGGYGFVLRVPVTIELLTESRAKILIDGTDTRRIVSRRSLISPPTMRGAKPEVEWRGEDPPR